MATASANEKAISSQLFVIGQNLLRMNKFTDAKEYLERALKIDQQITNNLVIDPDEVVILHEIGQCLIGMHRPADAKKFLERALII